jgi:glucokinase
VSDIFASVDLGGTTIACAFGRADGSVACERAIPTCSHEGPDAVIVRIARLVEGIAVETGLKPQAVGIGVPGLADVARGVTKFLPNLPTQWRDVPVADTLRPAVGCDVFVLNDVRMATLGELTFGHGRTAATFAFFALGTGVGGGVVIDGRLRLGPLGAAGELGHQTVAPDGPLCGCGNRGCLETVASGPAIAAEGVRLMLSGQAPRLFDLTEGRPGGVTTRTMAQAARAGDETVGEAIRRCGRFIGVGAANVAVAIHPDMVVLGGGVAQMGDILLDAVREEMRARVRMFPAESVRVERSLLGDAAGTLGGIALAMQGGLENNHLPRALAAQ